MAKKEQSPLQQSQSTTTTSSSQSPQSGFKPVGGFIYGIIAYIVAFITTTIYFFYELDDLTDGNIELVLPDEPEAIGWGFYNANRVDIAASSGGETIETINYIQEIDEINSIVFTAVLALVLFFAGYTVASRVRESLSDGASLVAGASIAVGYVPFLIVGTFLFEVEEGVSSAAPELSASLVVFGVLFSAGFGAVGGYLGGR